MEAANGAVPEGAAGEPRGSAAAPSGAKEVKVVIVGDGGCGKTSLLMVYAKGSFPEQYAPSVFEKYTTSVTVGKKEVTLNLYDTAGQEDYDRLRPLSYQNTNVVLICYDVMNPTSYDNVAAKETNPKARRKSFVSVPPVVPRSESLLPGGPARAHRLQDGPAEGQGAAAQAQGFQAGTHHLQPGRGSLSGD
ncbi:rho-related GTP-binding protein RhoF isoform X2 [Myiozetetes cayanensis]|uniref:rho-related GTP-binding protein RhoF isoform X2 n=1 Tax=Myiozetetes cayanensis TaxID=478635 RepID=UPI00215DFA79|nr:rho-related GTP-binding protein RhoF isoform X2 [Myiozetetes cayanensis]